MISKKEKEEEENENEKEKGGRTRRRRRWRRKSMLALNAKPWNEISPSGVASARRGSESADLLMRATRAMW